MFKRLILLCLALVLVGVLLTQSVFASSKYTTKWEKSNAPVNLPILMYHSVENKPGNGLCVPPEQLEQQLKYLHEQGYYTVTPAEAYKILVQNKVPKKHKKLVIVTFDDGYENNYTAEEISHSRNDRFDHKQNRHPRDANFKTNQRNEEK